MAFYDTVTPLVSETVLDGVLIFAQFFDKVLHLPNVALLGLFHPILELLSLQRPKHLQKAFHKLHDLFDLWMGVTHLHERLLLRLGDVLWTAHEQADRGTRRQSLRLR